MVSSLPSFRAFLKAPSVSFSSPGQRPLPSLQAERRKQPDISVAPRHAPSRMNQRRSQSHALIFLLTLFLSEEVGPLKTFWAICNAAAMSLGWGRRNVGTEVSKEAPDRASQCGCGACFLSTDNFFFFFNKSFTLKTPRLWCSSMSLSTHAAYFRKSTFHIYFLF